MKRWPTGVRSRSIRSRWSLRLSESPATNAPMIGASFAASASSAKKSVNASASATSVPAEREYCWTARNSGGPNLPPRYAVSTRNATATPTMPSTVRNETVPSVTMRTTTVRITSPSTSSATAAPEHRARLDGRQSAKIAEDPRGDADARRRERGTEEQRGVRVVVERDPDAVAHRHRQHDADHRDAHRRAPDGGEIADVHLEPDLQQQQDDAELGEHLEHLGRADEPEHGRADEHAGDDLADDRRHLDPLRDLRGDLRRDEHDQDVPKDLDDAHGLRRW